MTESAEKQVASVLTSQTLEILKYKLGQLQVDLAFLQSKLDMQNQLNASLEKKIADWKDKYSIIEDEENE